ncbi:creatininase family protein [Parasulfuritortus cantonensis]|uniref:Creatininase family protein n=1 Tax=Parasulfuritortus cantonensis TaxID=2528202 RepID=A0A4R1BD29_9PROT|nr:creatininase family protein [Parasulfuritortus cantonensis]TCJ14953.1 creatininase family protein [Parasulfuritortus cantonensis]
MLWQDLTWSEIPDVLARCGQAAILPVGATEQHGPHLGTGVDFIIAERLCAAVAARTGVPMLPTLPYGCSLGHSRRWPGTLALPPVTLIEVVKQIGDWAYHSGIRRLFIVNAHVTNAAPLRCALEMLRAEHDDLMVAVINTATISERVRHFHFADAEDWHANDAETSIMLAIAPDSVRPDKFAEADDPDRTCGCVFAHPVNRTSANGVTGTPSQASRGKGQVWFDWLVEDLAERVRIGCSEQPPLPHSYFETA